MASLFSIHLETINSSGGTPEAQSPLFVSQSVSQQLLCLHVEDKPAKKEITSKANSETTLTRQKRSHVKSKQLKLPMKNIPNFF
jgi:hypothetical protein